MEMESPISMRRTMAAEMRRRTGGRAPSRMSCWRVSSLRRWRARRESWEGVGGWHLLSQWMSIWFFFFLVVVVVFACFFHSVQVCVSVLDRNWALSVRLLFRRSVARLLKVSCNLSCIPDVLLSQTVSHTKTIPDVLGAIKTLKLF